MPVTINQNKVKFKHPTQQGFIAFDTVASETSQQLQAQLQQKATEIRQSWPENYDNLTSKVNNLVKFQDTAPSTSSTTQVWVDTSSNAEQVAIPTMEEFNSLKNSVLTVNATPVSTSNLSQWTDLTLDKTNTEILTAAASGNCIINLNIFGTTIICHQWERSTNSVFFNGFSIDNVLFIYNINITQSAASVMRLGYIPIEQA